ncbi:hypothetical protein KO505_09705 [Psychrosphaera sp. F3M07]|uniref:Cthe_2314 family HEPN domain-containing protein n=1 Tax=Psychrosphaera sp. F3M07 TaxID=2841560 RepID=UPI001C088C57|nr:hypothetical protein [Psychrosphaera sp. F3M07]
MHLIHHLILLDEDSPLRKGIEVIDSKLSVDTVSDLDYYLISCAKAYCSLTSSVDKAKLSISLLSYENITKFDTDSQSISDFIELFIENTIIRIQSIYDRTLIFVNRLLELGISNECINHSTLVTNDNVKKYGLDKKLKSLNKACSEYRNIRNTIIHHDRYSEENLDMLSMVHQVEFASKQEGKKTLIPESQLNEITELFMTDSQGELGEYLEEIESKLHEIYNSACVIYAKKKLAYQKI